MTARWRIATARARPAALAVIDLTADDESSLDAALEPSIGGSIEVGRLALRSIASIDTGVIARLSPQHAVLMPHGGPAVLDALAEAFAQLGFHRAADPTLRERFPEAVTELEAAMLAALARAQSPLAVDLLLDQPRRWAGLPDRPITDRDRRLRRLIDPPVVAVVGPPNVGKSSLLNALVGRDAALVADEAGTTRDHIGATVDLAGLVVHWVDTPGRRDAAGLEAQAIRAAEPVIAAADLVVAVSDAAGPDPRTVSPRSPDLVIAARADLGLPDWPHEAAVAAQAGEGVGALVTRLRDTLVPPEDRKVPEPWRFWD